MGKAKRKGLGRQNGEPKTKRTKDARSIAAPDEIHTARLLLRKPRATDAPLMFTAYAQDPAVTRYLMWRPHANIAETRLVIDRFLTAWERQEGFCWFLLPKTPER
jgi:RimJ/RimL family protein N-acetyltransferase